MWNEPDPAVEREAASHFCAVGTRCHSCLIPAQCLPCATWWGHLKFVGWFLYFQVRFRSAGSQRKLTGNNEGRKDSLPLAVL